MARRRAGRLSAAQFADFARSVERSAPLYADLASGVAADDHLTGLLLAAPVAQRQPVLLFACVHWLLLPTRRRPARRVVSEPDGGAPPLRRDRRLRPLRPRPRRRAAVAAEHAERRRPTRSDVRRCSCRRSAMLDAECRPLARIDVGASAGLNLLADALHYDYEPGGAVGPPRRVRPAALPHRGRGARADRAPPIRRPPSASTPTRSTSVTPTRRGGWRRASGPTRSSASTASRRRSRSPGRSASTCAAGTPSPIRRALIAELAGGATRCSPPAG